jgi:hypothetical protein
VAGRGQHSSVPVFIAGEKTAKYTNAAPGTPIQSCGAGIPPSCANGNWALLIRSGTDDTQGAGTRDHTAEPASLLSIARQRAREMPRRR